MVRIAAITASLVMSSQVGATAVRTTSAASANSSASRIQVANLSQIWRPSISPARPLAITDQSACQEAGGVWDLDAGKCLAQDTKRACELTKGKWDEAAGTCKK